MKSRVPPTFDRSRAVLIVDDDPLYLRSVGRQLGTEGYACTLVSGAGEARRTLDECEFALALVDVQMESESGVGLMEHIRRRWPDTATVMVTGRDDPELAYRALAGGAYGYIIKPFQPNELLIGVANALLRRRLEIENRHHRERLEDIVRIRTADLQVAVSNLRQAHRETIHRLVQVVESRSDETGKHIERVGEYSYLLGRALGLSEERSEMLRIASPMHDIGKVGIPDAVLLKPGPLTLVEFEIMKRHPELGHTLLRDSQAEDLRLGASIAWTHHERWDGAGYPMGLAGEDIPLEGRITTVVDVFDALMSDRVYRPAFGLDQTLQIMRQGRGSRFDPMLLDVFLDGVGDYL
jgi:putative two-component system response regulator